MSRTDERLTFLSALLTLLGATFGVGMMSGYAVRNQDAFLWAVAPVEIVELGDGDAFSNDVLVVRDNHGGTVHTFTRRWQAVVQLGLRVIIDGECSSACTHVLWQVPREMVCITPNARMGFHLARDQVTQQPLPEFSALLDRNYPQPIRAWLATQQPLTVEKVVYLPFGVLNSYYRLCDEVPPVFIHYEDEE